MDRATGDHVIAGSDEVAPGIVGGDHQWDVRPRRNAQDRVQPEVNPGTRVPIVALVPGLPGSHPISPVAVFVDGVDLEGPVAIGEDRWIKALVPDLDLDPWNYHQGSAADGGPGVQNIVLRTTMSG